MCSLLLQTWGTNTHQERYGAGKKSGTQIGRLFGDNSGSEVQALAYDGWKLEKQQRWMVYSPKIQSKERVLRVSDLQF